LSAWTDRRGPLVDLGLWLAAASLTVAVGLLLSWARIPGSARLIPGEPIGMIYLLAAATWVLRRRGETWPGLGLRAPASLWRTAGLALAGLIATYGLGAILVLALLRPLHMAAPVMAPVLGSPGSYAIMILLTWTTVAFGEEMLFRAFLFSRLERLFSGRPGPGPRAATVAAWLAQGAIFGLLHAYQGPGGVVVTMAIGLVLGAVYLRARRNLAPCILMHGVIDTLSLTALFYVTSHHIKLPPL
jgi:membrane protease YdiL (CAAX protease family)